MLPVDMAENNVVRITEPRRLLADARQRLSRYLQNDSSNRLEHRSLLVTNCSRLPNVQPQTRVACFAPLLFAAKEDGAAPAVALQLLQLICECNSEPTAKFIVSRPEILRALFKASDVNIHAWFAHFSMDGWAGFKYGAYALARYALAHREHAWAHLAWEGKHPQAPVAVATRPHYFCELNVVKTVHNLLDFCPEFWESEELHASLKSGEFISIDFLFFCKELYNIAHARDRGLDALQRLVTQYLSREQYTVLCQRLLHLADDDQLLQVINVLAKECGTLQELLQVSWQKASLLPLVLGKVYWRRLDDVLLCHTLACERAQLARLLREDERGQQLLAWMQRSSQQLLALGPSASGLSSLLGGWSQQLRETEVRTSLALLSWLLQLFLVDEVQQRPAIAQAALQRLGFTLECTRGPCLQDSAPPGNPVAAHARAHPYALLSSPPRNHSKKKKKRKTKKSKHGKRGKKRRREHSERAHSSSEASGYDAEVAAPPRAGRSRVRDGGSDTGADSGSPCPGLRNSGKARKHSKRQRSANRAAGDSSGSSDLPRHPSKQPQQRNRREGLAGPHDSDDGSSDSRSSSGPRRPSKQQQQRKRQEPVGLYDSGDGSSPAASPALGRKRRRRRQKRAASSGDPGSDSSGESSGSAGLLAREVGLLADTSGEEGELAATTTAATGVQWRVVHNGHAVVSSVTDVCEYICGCLLVRWVGGDVELPDLTGPA